MNSDPDREIAGSKKSGVRTTIQKQIVRRHSYFFGAVRLVDDTSVKQARISQANRQITMKGIESVQVYPRKWCHTQPIKPHSVLDEHEETEIITKNKKFEKKSATRTSDINSQTYNNSQKAKKGTNRERERKRERKPDNNSIPIMRLTPHTQVRTYRSHQI
jgi:hypothetical protein